MEQLQGGGPTAVINQTAPLWKISAGEFQAVINVNIAGTANVIRHFVPAMVDRQQGIIVNFSSGWGRSTSPNVAPYCATKYAIEGLTLAMSAEFAWVLMDRNSQDLATLREEKGVQTYPTPPAVLEAQFAAWDRMIDRESRADPRGLDEP